MPRYHFHVLDGSALFNLCVDELPDYDAALACAERLARGLLRSQPDLYGRDPDAWEIRVTDDRGTDVLALPLSEVAARTR